jgi:hypothetical protein
MATAHITMISVPIFCTASVNEQTSGRLSQAHGIHRINTFMTQHQSPLVADLTTDIILYPTSDRLRVSPDDPLVFARARRAVKLYFDLLQAILAKHGHQITLDRIDHDPAIGWLIHYRTADPVTITMLHDVAAGDPGPGDPVELNFLISQPAVGDSLSV